MQDFSKPRSDGLCAGQPLVNAAEEQISRPADASRIARLLERLSQSAFRSRQRLRGDDLAYARRHSAQTLRTHAERFIRERLAPAVIPNDGRQTPWHGHPVFVAQHACACCCRKCLFKWQRIPPDRPLTEAEIESIADLLMSWIRRELDERAEDPELRGNARRRICRSAARREAEPSLFD